RWSAARIRKGAPLPTKRLALGAPSPALRERVPRPKVEAGEGNGSLGEENMQLARRSFMLAGAAAADFGSGGASAWAADTPSRYPDPNIKVLDPRFSKYMLGNAAIERIAGGCRFNEGPVWFGDGRYLLWSDIPNDRIMKWEEETGAIGVFRKPSNYANGNTRDRQGRLVTCERDAQLLTRTEYDRSTTVLAESH